MNRLRPETEQGKAAAVVSERIAVPRPCLSVRGLTNARDRFGIIKSMRHWSSGYDIPLPTGWPGFDSPMAQFCIAIYILTHRSSVGRAGDCKCTSVVIPRSMVRIRPVRLIVAGWPSGLRRWFKAPVSSEARVRISHQSLFWLPWAWNPYPSRVVGPNAS